MCKAEKARGRQLLTTLVGLFVSNSDQDIEISFRGVELGWKIKDGKTKVGGNNNKNNNNIDNLLKKSSIRTVYP